MLTKQEMYSTKTSKTVVLTSIYNEFWGTQEFRKSCHRVGLPVHNAWQTSRFTGHGETLRYDYEALLKLKDTYDFAIYADGADSIFLKPFTPPAGCILYSTEKAIWPPTPQMHEAWAEYYNKLTAPGNIDLGYNDPYTGFYFRTPWKYLNGGGWCGPIHLLIEFFERYGLNKLKGDINGQDYQALAFLKAQAEGFPIYLDTQCQYFQTTGFEDPGDFEYSGQTEFGPPYFKNKKTNHYPCILHGNGRTGMDHLYKLLNR